MKKQILFLSLLGSLVFFYACQKELSLEVGKNASEGSLQSNSTNDCLPKVVAGAYEQGKPLDGTVNYIEVEVIVTKPGSYTIYTDTLNGIYFRATGIFTTVGTNTIRLKGNGTPFSAGITNFVVTYGSSECLVSVTVLSAGGGGPAVFSLAGTPGTCMNASVSGNYIVGVPLTSSNFVVINVNVTTIGTYNITTAMSNGIVFSGSGTLGSLGAATITLTASGTPANAGSTNIPVTAGTSSCSFVIDVVTPATAGDYFPRTANSNWSYENDGDFNDSLLIRAKSGTVTIAGNTYTVFEATDNAPNGFITWGNYRKSGSNYYSYADMGEYFGFDNSINMEYIFLRDDLPSGGSWQTPTINGMVGTTPIPIRIVFTVEQKGGSLIVGGTTYTNTMTIIEKYEINAGGSNWVDVTDILGYFKTYYAKDVGRIKEDYYYEDGNTNPPIDSQQDLRRYAIF